MKPKIGQTVMLIRNDVSLLCKIIKVNNTKEKVLGFTPDIIWIDEAEPKNK